MTLHSGLNTRESTEKAIARLAGQIGRKPEVVDVPQVEVSPDELRAEGIFEDAPGAGDEGADTVSPVVGIGAGTPLPNLPGGGDRGTSGKTGPRVTWRE